MPSAPKSPRQKKSGSSASHPPLKAYDTDLAYIHDAGFGGFAAGAAAFLTKYLPAHGIPSGKIVELGCGSGLQAQRMAEAGYQTLGFDLSPAMVELAIRRVPSGTFRAASFVDAEIPPCQVVTAVGEIFNYLFDQRNSLATLKRVFRRVYAALEPGGVFLFDVALVGRVPEGTRRTYVEQPGDARQPGCATLPDWTCLYEATEDRVRKTIVRQIASYRRHGDSYRRDTETHRLRTYERDELRQPLEQTGFRVRVLRGYEDFRFPPGYAGFLATKPR